MGNKKTNNIKNPPKVSNIKSVIALLFFAFLLMIFYNSIGGNTVNNVSLNTLIEKYNSGIYSGILINGNIAEATISGSITNDNFFGRKVSIDKAVLPATDSLTELGFLKNENNVATVIEIKDNTSAKFWLELFPTLLTIAIFGVLAFFLISRMGGMANNAMFFSKSRARLYDKSKDKITFDDVAGALEEKEELQEVIEFLKNPKKFKDLGAKIPRGILMVGAPGTGKTMLARAVAGESNVPFLSISGSEFVEMFVGVGASRVRDLFATAKELAPAIIFIDEIDAIGKKRGAGTGGGHDEREQTLNQILTEMDGFDNDTNVIVMGATNRADVLDKALLRPGRFDRKITVRLPNIADREKILEVHVKNKKMTDDVDLKSLASETVGFSGADLGNLVNEAAIISARHNEKIISSQRFQEAFERVVMGLKKKSLVMDEKERKITAYHEIGHALVGQLLPNTDPVHKISITPRGGALGVTWFLPEKDELLTSKAKFLDELATLYGGRAAEEIFFGKDNITTGASNDIERATDIARAMVIKYGMFDEIGKINLDSSPVDGNYLGVESQRPIFSEETQKLIDTKVKEILDKAYNTAIKLIKENKKLHTKIAETLLEKEEISREEFSAFFKDDSEEDK